MEGYKDHLGFLYDDEIFKILTYKNRTSFSAHVVFMVTACIKPPAAPIVKHIADKKR